MTNEEILDRSYQPKMHWKSVNRRNVLSAMDAAREDEAGKMLDFAEYFRNNFEYYDCNANGHIYKNVSNRSESAMTMKEILSKWKHKNEKK